MLLVHIEDIKIRSDDKSILSPYKKGVDIVDKLRITGESHFICMAIEYVERQPRNERIPQARIIAEQIIGGYTRIGFMPGPPLIHHQLDSMLTICLSHNLPMVTDQLLHNNCIGELFVPLLDRELIGQPSVGAAAVIMQCKPEHVAERPGPLFSQLREKAFGPAVIGDIRTRSDEVQIQAVSRNPLGIAAKLDRVLVSGEISTASPAFIAYPPILNVERRTTP